MGFTEHDHLIQTFTADGANHTLRIRILPWRPRCGDDFLNADVSDALAELVAVDAVAVTNQEPWRFIIRRRFDDLLACPARRWMGGDIEVNDATPVMSKHDKAVQQAESHSRHHEELNCSYLWYMILKERAPRLRWRFSMTDHVCCDRRFGYDVSEQL